MIRIEDKRIKNYEFSEVTRDGVKIGNVFPSAGRGIFKAEIYVETRDMHVAAFGYGEAPQTAVMAAIRNGYYETNMDEFSEMMEEEVV